MLLSKLPSKISTSYSGKSLNSSFCGRQNRKFICCAQSKVGLQLATAKLPTSSDSTIFAAALYQWAATLTTNGRNLPFALPLKVDKVNADSFSIGLLRVTKDGIAAVGEITTAIEGQANGDRVLFVRLYEGPASRLVTGEAAGSTKGLKMLLDALVDIPVIMNTMPMAIRNAAKASIQSE